MASDQEQFAQMMMALQSPDNQLRKHAEETYQQTKSSNGNWLFQALVELAGSSENDALQKICLIELRKILLHPQFRITNFSEDEVQHVKDRSMAMMANAKDSIIRNLASECTGHVASQLYREFETDNGGKIMGPGWPELFPLLCNTMTDKSNSKELRTACSRVFAALGEEAVDKGLKKDHISVATAFYNAMSKDGSELDANVAFISNLGDLITYVEDSYIRHYVGACNKTLDVFAAALNAQKWEEAREIASVISDIISSQPAIFGHNAKGVLDGMYNVAAAVDSVPKECRFGAVECLLTYCEIDPKTVRKCKYTDKIFGLLLEYLKRPTFEDDRLDSEVPEEDVDEQIEKCTDWDIACVGVDRWATSLRAKHVREIAANAIVGLIRSDQWQDRFAAASAITYIMEACSEHFQKQAAQILGFIIPLLNDESGFVRDVAALAMCQACNDFAPVLQREHYATFLPAICRNMTDRPRIAQQCCSAVGAFFEVLHDETEEIDSDDDLKREYGANYVGPLLDNLLPVIENTPELYIKREALFSVGLMAECVGKYMAPFVERIVPLCQRILQMGDGEFGSDDMKAINKLRCLALQAVTLLAQSVGYDAFQNYASDVADFLLNQMQSNMPYTDPRSEYVICGWTNMTRCLQARVEPYLTTVLENLLNIAMKDCDYDLVEDDAGDDKRTLTEQEKEEGIVYQAIDHPEKGRVNARFRTSEATEKQLALETMENMGQTLKEHAPQLLYPWLDKIAQAGMKNLDFLSLKEVRLVAADIVKLAYEMYHKHDQSSVLNICRGLWPQIMAKIKNEPIVAVVQRDLELLREILDLAPNNCVNEEDIAHSGGVLCLILHSAIARKQECYEARQLLSEEDEAENEKLDGEEETEDQLISCAADAMVEAMKRNPGFSRHYEEQILESIVPSVLSANMANAETRVALFLIYGYVAAATSQPSITGIEKVLQQACETFLNYGSHEHPELAQVAIYGCGGIVEYMKKSNHSQLGEFSQAVYQLLGNFWSKHPPNSNMKDTDPEYGYEDVRTNAVSVALTLIENVGENIDQAPLWKAIGATLPCREDEEECCIVHEKLLRWALGENKMVANNAELKNGIINALKNAKENCLNSDTKSELAKL